MNYDEARIEALQKKIALLEGKIAYLEAYIEVNINTNYKFSHYENE